MTYPIDRIRRHPERARTQRAELNAVLDAGEHVGALATVVDGLPWVVPMLYARVGDRILLHGSTGAGALRHVAAGASAALCVTHVDGWVYAHTLFDSSANFRSAVVRGTLTRLSGDDAAEALTQFSDGVFPGRSGEVPPHSGKHLAATQALALYIVEGQWTVKVRDEAPGEPGANEVVAADLWTGVVPMRTVCGPPQAAARVAASVPVSASVLSYVEENQ